MAEVRTTDKAPLQAVVQSIGDQVAGAVDQIELKHPSWKVATVDITLKGCLRPIIEKDKSVVIYLDIDEPSKIPVSEIPIRLERNWFSRLI